MIQTGVEYENIMKFTTKTKINLPSGAMRIFLWPYAQIHATHLHMFPYYLPISNPYHSVSLPHPFGLENSLIRTRTDKSMLSWRRKRSRRHSRRLENFTAIENWWTGAWEVRVGMAVQRMRYTQYRNNFEFPNRNAIEALSKRNTSLTIYYHTKSVYHVDTVVETEGNEPESQSSFRTVLYNSMFSH